MRLQRMTATPYAGQMLKERLAASSELVRPAGILATVLAHAMGNSAIDADVLRTEAIVLLGRWIDSTPLLIDLRKSLVDCAGKRSPAQWKLYLDDWHKPKALPKNSKDAIAGIMLPLDGASSLVQGRAGTMCWLGISQLDDFLALRQLEPGSFLVLTVGPRHDIGSVRERIRGLHNVVATTQKQTLAAFLKTSDSLNDVIGDQGLLGAHTMDLSNFRHTHPLPGRYGLSRWLDGSAVVSAVAALTRRTDFGFCVCRKPALAAIVAAARAIGGAVLAVPIQVTGKQTVASNVVVEKSASFVDADSLLKPDAHVILVGSSVTEICVSDRVRWNAMPWVQAITSPYSAASPAHQATTHMSVHSVLFDTRGAQYEERRTDWDVSRVECFRNTSLLKVINSHQTRWKDLWKAASVKTRAE